MPLWLQGEFDGCMPSTCVFPQELPSCCQGMLSSMSLSLSLSSLCGHLCGLTAWPGWSSALLCKRERPTSQGVGHRVDISMYHTQALTSRWHQISLGADALPKKATAPGYFGIHHLLLESKQGQNNHSWRVLVFVEIQKLVCLEDTSLQSTLGLAFAVSPFCCGSSRCHRSCGAELREPTVPVLSASTCFIFASGWESSSCF